MESTLIRHFKEYSNNKVLEISEISKEINFRQDSLNVKTITDSLIKKENKKINQLKLTKERLESSYIFDLKDRNKTKDLLKIDDSRYKELDEKIENIIITLCQFFTEVSTSEENKRRDKQNHTTNKSLKKQFLLYYPFNQHKYLWTLKSKQPNRLLHRNKLNIKKLKKLDEFFTVNKEIVPLYKKLETYSVHTITEPEMMKETNFLTKNEIAHLVSPDALDILDNLIFNEVLLKIKLNKCINDIDIDIMEDFSTELEKASNYILKNMLKEKRKDNSTPEEIWDSII